MCVCVCVCVMVCDGVCVCVLSQEEGRSKCFRYFPADDSAAGKANHIQFEQVPPHTHSSIHGACL